MATEARQMTVDQEMYERMAGSSALYDRAKETFPSGVTHDARFAKPFPIYVSRAQGSRKWDVDGNEYVDSYGGHGALILGHCHPVVPAAVVEQAEKGSPRAAPARAPPPRPLPRARSALGRAGPADRALGRGRQVRLLRHRGHDAGDP